MVHQSVFELIHTDDRALFRRQLHFALKPDTTLPDGTAQSPSESTATRLQTSFLETFLTSSGCSLVTAGELSSADISSGVKTYDPQSIPPENSSFLERNFCCRFRCLLDNSSGFLVTDWHRF